MVGCTSMEAELKVPVAVDHEHASLEGMWALCGVVLDRGRIDSKLPCVTPLWPHNAPGFRHRRNELEEAKSYWVRNVHSLSLTAFLPPKDIATGAVVIICPGGGHAELVFGVEWSGVEWRGVEWSGVEWSGVEWSGVEGRGVSVCSGFKRVAWRPLS